MKEKILVVDDEKDLLNLLEYNLSKAGFRIVTAVDGPEAITVAKSEKPDLILLDLMLPSLDGTEVCKILKRDDHTSHIPVIMLTAKGEEIDRIIGFEIGADDYVTKPFSPRELVLRIKAVIRRGQENKAIVINAGPVTIDFDRSMVTVEEKPVQLTSTEFNLLSELVKAKGKVLSRDLLLDRAWGRECYVTDRTVDTHIRRLRQKLGKFGDFIETLRKFGYRFKENKD